MVTSSQSDPNDTKVDAELNLLRRTHISHRTISGTENHGHLHTDLYRGRKGCTSLDPVMITTMPRESFHLQRANAGTTDCDTAACYNRMIVGPTSVAETNAGTPEEVSVTSAHTLEKMQYHMSTKKGTSKEYNCHSKEHPSYGIGQGACNSPLKWNFNDNILAKAYSKKAYGCIIHNPTRNIVKKCYSADYWK
eukprot:1800860-Ditylum_brightwellii.AAC.1